MEEVYVIKLKGLPLCTTPSAKNSIDDKDLSREAILGCGLLQSFIGVLSLIFYSIDLLVAGKSAIGMFASLIYLVAGLVGIWASIRRKNQYIGSRRLVKIFLLVSLIALKVSFLLLALIIAGVMCDESVTQFVKSNIIISDIIEMLFAAISAFTAVRVLWPTKFMCCAKYWPQKPAVKQKIIVATSIFARSAPAAQCITRCLGPNCVVSLATQRQLPSIEPTTVEEYIEENIYENCDVYSDVYYNNEEKRAECETKVT